MLPRTGAAPSARIGFVGCVKSQRSTPQKACDLYDSPLFRGRVEAVSGTCDEWFILSTKYGLVAPGVVIAPYDVDLLRAPSGVRRAWASMVLDQLRKRFPSLGSCEFEMHASAAYVDFGLVDGLRRAGASVIRPMAGLTRGEQLSRYANGRSDNHIRTGKPGGKGEERRSLYAPLVQSLEVASGPTVELSFRELEVLLGRQLPPSAIKRREWWANSEQSSQGRAWLGAGWKVRTVDLFGRRVRFVRGGQTSNESAEATAQTESNHSGGRSWELQGVTGDDIERARVSISEVRESGPFKYRWPDLVEEFHRSWEYVVEHSGRRVRVKHGLSYRHVFGRRRVHSVTFVNGAPLVKGAECDDYAESSCLVSLVKSSSRKDVRSHRELPPLMESLRSYGTTKRLKDRMLGTLWR